MKPTSPQVTRRSFVVSAGAATVVPPAVALVAGSAGAAAAAAHHPAGSSPPAPASAAAPVPPASLSSTQASSTPERPVYLFFNVAEVQFIEAACERLIPADEAGAGALAAGVPNYLDKQLGGAWGAGERLYRSGPWIQGSASQGYQLPFTPAELFRTALRAINTDLARLGPAGWGSTRVAPLAGLPDTATEGTLLRCPVPQGGGQPGSSSFSPAVIEPEPAV